MTPILFDFARKSGFTLCKEESALREMLEQFAKFIIEHEAAKQHDNDPVAWATAVGSHAHISWGKNRPDYPIRYEVPLYTTPPVQPAPVQEPVAWLYPEGLEALRRGKCWTAYGTKQDDNCNIPVYLNAAIAPKVEPAKAECGGFDSHLAAPVQPVGTYGEIYESMQALLRSGLQRDQQIYAAMKDKPLYTSPPAAQRQWVGLTDEQIESLWDHGMYVHCSGITALRAITRAIEAKLKEKNT